MALRADVANRKYSVSDDLMLNAKVVLFGVLRAQMRLELAEKQNGTETRPINRRAMRRSQHAAKWIGDGPRLIGATRHSAGLGNKRRVKKRLGAGSAASKGGLSLELLQRQLFDWVIKDSKTATHRGLAVMPRVPCNPNSGSKRAIVG